MNNENEDNKPFSIWEDVGMAVYNPRGIVTVTVNGQPSPICVICKGPYHDWDPTWEKLNHPFCKNNLEYLEWENERRQRKI